MRLFVGRNNFMECKKICNLKLFESFQVNKLAPLIDTIFHSLRMQVFIS